MKFTSLAALQVVIVTTCDMASDENFIKVTFLYQSMRTTYTNTYVTGPKMVNQY